ncbi:Uncharacterised protein [Escherichia coli]|nr:Uncharacterised protein [Escherichia coli]CAD5794433.1 Uncharacterised protein [Escherichia coli]
MLIKTLNVTPLFIGWVVEHSIFRLQREKGNTFQVPIVILLAEQLAL